MRTDPQGTSKVSEAKSSVSASVMIDVPPPARTIIARNAPYDTDGGQYYVCLGLSF